MSHFAKVWLQILDSSIAEDWKTRHVFEDLLKLAWPDGIVDATPESIARRTNTPLDVVQAAIIALESPDHESRTPDHEGRRLVRLDAHRSWGWKVVNWSKFKESANCEMLRLAETERKRRYRSKFSPSPKPPTSLEKEQRERETSPRQVPDCPGPVRDKKGPNEKDSLPHIPSAQEVTSYGEAHGVPKDFCEHYHAVCTEKHRWIVKSPTGERVIGWQSELVRWWSRDRQNWKPTTNAANKTNAEILNEAL